VPTVVDSATVKQACAFCRQRKKRCPHLVATPVRGPKVAAEPLRTVVIRLPNLCAASVARTCGPRAGERGRRMGARR